MSKVDGTMGNTIVTSRGPYLLAVAAVAIAAIVRWLLDPLFGNHLTLLTFYVAVAVVAWFGGLRPALLAAVMGLALAVVLFVPNNPDLGLRQISDVYRVDWLRYAVIALTFAFFGEAKNTALRRADLRRETLQVTLASIGDGVIVTDVDGNLTSLNPVAEALTGWILRDAVGLPLGEVFNIVNEETREPVANPVTRVLEHGGIV
ncbi:MAG: DUF4118 domain-containing protein, partial [Burkholderiaceae bacterium]